MVTTTNPTTRGQIVDQVARFIQDTSAAEKTMAAEAIDRAFKLALVRYPWPHLLRWVDSAVTVAKDDAFFHTPIDARHVLAVLDQTNTFTLDPYDIADLPRQVNGFVNRSGAVTQYHLVGEVGINIVPAAGGITVTLIVDAADSGRVVHLVGRQSNHPFRFTATTAGASISVPGTWNDIFQVYTETANDAVDLDVRNEAGLAIIGHIGRGEFASRFYRYRIYPIPDADTTLRILYRYSPPEAFQDSFTYPIPNIEMYLFEYGVAKIFQQRRQHDLAAPHFAEAERIFATLIEDQETQRMRQAVPLVPRMRPFVIVST